MLEPIVTSIANVLATEATVVFNTSQLPDQEYRAVIEDQISALSKRSEGWTAEGFDSEFDKVVRSLRIALYQEIAVQKAKQVQGATHE